MKPDNNLENGYETTPPSVEPPSGTTPEAEEPQRRFRVFTCVAGIITPAYMMMSEVLDVDIKGVDFHWDKVFGGICIRTPHSGFREYLCEIPGLGPDVGLLFLEDIMWAGGEFLTEKQLNGTLTSLRDTDPRGQQVARLRKAFGDSVADEWYFIVKRRPWRIAWNRARSWRIIERLS